MSVKDMIKKSVLESGAFTNYDVPRILTALVAALLLGALIYLVYRKFYAGVVFSRTFAVTLVGMTVLTCMVTLAISTNVVISLGMVGALSIVRFRTAIKDPMDLLFLFWSIGTGIICGAGLYKIAIILAILVTIGIMILDVIPLKTNAYLLIVNGDGGCSEGKISDIAAKYGKLRLRSKNVNRNGIDMIFEIRFKGNDNGIIEELMKVEGIQNVSLLVHDGEVKN